MNRRWIFSAMILAAMFAGLFDCASVVAQGAGTKGKVGDGTAPERQSEDRRSQGGVEPSARQKLLDEGESKFRANCGRCHQSPHHLAPRVVMTVERHMRVRATLTDEDVRVIVGYLTQ